jgi:hypothetical protein
MGRYQGITNAHGVSDQIKGGGSEVVKHGFGHEIFNFKPHLDYYYGYVQPRGNTIKIERLGASKQDNYIEGVSAIWVSTSPEGRSYIVGWYKEATVYRKKQDPPLNSERIHNGEECGFFIKTKKENGRILDTEERQFQIPRGKNGIGQSNVWFADKPIHEELRQRVADYVNGKWSPRRTVKSKSHRTTDNEKKRKIEKIAIKVTREHYKKLGYAIESVESEDKGWDLSAYGYNKHLKLEVKGLQADSISIELTPNEYEKMKEHKHSYIICVVTNALNNPQLVSFSFSPENNHWEDKNGKQLVIEERAGARMKSVSGKE